MVPQHPRGARRLDVGVDGEHPGEHARHVAIDQRRPLAVRDRRDGAGGVRADAGHLTQLVGARRQSATPARHHLARAAVEVARATVEAQPRPRREHVVERRGGQRAHGGEALHPALPVRDDGGHPRLLQHDLAHPDRIGVTHAAPGQIAPAPAIPVSDRDGERRERGWLGHRPSTTGASRRGRPRRAGGLAAAWRSHGRQTYHGAKDRRQGPPLGEREEKNARWGGTEQATSPSPLGARPQARDRGDGPAAAARHAMAPKTDAKDRPARARRKKKARSVGVPSGPCGRAHEGPATSS